MHTRTKLLLALAPTLGLFIASAVARRDPEPPGSDHASTEVLAYDTPTGSVLIDIDDDASPEDQREVLARLVAAIAPFDWPRTPAGLGDELNDDANLFRLTPPASEVDDVMAALADDPNVEVAEVERSWDLPEAAAYVRPDAPRARDGGEHFVPDDPYYGFQWHLDQIGMPEAWTRNRGAGVIVAVIDTGVAYRDEDGFARAPDLADTRIVDGYDFVRNDPHPDDEHGHGTHVAGTIAQSTNNGVGVAGVAPEAAIMPLKVLDRNGSGSWGGIAAAIRYAADHDANVINMSLGGGMPSRAVQRAIDYAHDKGVIVIAAAGNASRDRVEYPARHRHVVSVGAVRYDRELTFYSCYGDGLDIVAPGGDLRVDQNGDGMPDGVLQNTIVRGNPGDFDYLAWQGTSMAAPHVAGVAALVYSSGIQDPDTVEHLLEQSAEDLGDPTRYGSGLVSASHALRNAQQGAGAARGVAALGLSFMLLMFLRRRRLLGVKPWRTGLIALLAAGGIGILPFGLLPVVGEHVAPAMALGVLGTPASWLGPFGALIFLSVLPAFLAVAVGLHVERARPALVGLAIGSAAFLFVEAFWPTLRVALLPSLVVGPWLVLQGLLALGLGFLVARRGR